MRAEDIEKLVSVGRPTVHPAGDRAVAAVSHPDLEADTNVGQLWAFPLAVVDRVRTPALALHSEDDLRRHLPVDGA